MSLWGEIDRSVVFRRKVWMAVLVVVASCSVATVGAATIDDNKISDCMTIHEPGQYVVTEDIRAPPSTGVCLRVRASDVVVRGESHSIIAAGRGSVGVGVGSLAGVSNVSMSNVTVTGWQVGVGYGNVDGGTIEAIEARGNVNGVRLARTRHVRVSEALVTDNGGVGVFLSNGSTDNTVTGVVASDNRRGLRLDRSNDNYVIDSQFRTNERGGVFVLTSDGNTLRGNEIVDTRGYGVDISRSNETRLVNTTVTDPTETGVRLGGSHGTVILDVIVTNGSADGIELRTGSTRTLVSDVRVTDGRGTGVRLSNASNNTLQRLTVARNDVGLLLAGTDSTDAANVTAAGNRIGVRLEGSNDNRFRDVLVRRFSASTVSEVGISVVGSARNTFVDTTVRGDPNVTSYHGTRDVGVRVEGGEANRFTTLVASENSVAVRFDAGGGHTVTNATLFDNDDALSASESDEFALVGSNVTDNGDGISLRDLSGGRIVDTRVIDNDLTGIGLSDTDARVIGCVVRYNGGSGVALSTANRSVVADTVTALNGEHGVDLSGTSDAQITNVSASRNRFDGINITAYRPGGWPTAAFDNTVTDSTVVGNVRDGVAVDGATGTRLSDVTGGGNRFGLSLTASPAATITGLASRDNAAAGVLVRESNDTTLARVTASGNVDSGIRVVGADGVDLSNVTARRNFGNGIEFNRSNHSVLQASEAANNAGYGVVLERGRDTRISAVTAVENGISGIRLRHVDDWYVADSVGAGNEGGAGIAATTSNGTAIGNRVTGNAQGIEIIGTNNTLSNNVAERNRGHGLYVTTFESRGHNEIRNNTVVANGDIGIGVYLGTFSGGDVVANNTVRNNGIGDSGGGFGSGGIHVGSHRARIVGNLVADNTGFGIEVDSSGSTVQNNRIVENTRAGIELERTDETNILGNEIRANEYGVHVGYYYTQDREGEIVFPSTETTISRNEITESEGANVLLQGSQETRISNNTLRGSTVGVRVEPVRYTQFGREETAHATGTEISDNAMVDHEAFGVENTDTVLVNATQNYWGAPDGPSSPVDPDAPFVDPVTGVLANGSGDAVSESRTVAGVSNVRFDPFLTNGTQNASVNR